MKPFGEVLFSLAEAGQLLLQGSLAGGEHTGQQDRFLLSFGLYQCHLFRNPHLSPGYEGVGLSKESAKVETQSFPCRDLIRVLCHPYLEAFEGMLKDNGQFGGGWGCMDALTTTFKREEARGRGSIWRLASERCSVTNSGGLGGRRRHRPTPLEKDRPLCGVLIKFDLHYHFVFLTGRRNW